METKHERRMRLGTEAVEASRKAAEARRAAKAAPPVRDLGSPDPAAFWAWREQLQQAASKGEQPGAVSGGGAPAKPNGTSGGLSGLRRVRDELAAIDALKEERDLLIILALEEGHSYRKIAVSSGLSSAGVGRIALRGGA